MTSRAPPPRSGLSEERRALGGGLFGRQKGKALRAEQQAHLETVLPRIALTLPSGSGEQLDPHELFTHGPARIILEIGFGGGEHLLHRARTHPRDAFIGVEPFLNGVAKVVSIVEREAIANLRLHRGDAIDVLRALPRASLTRIDMLYPDPWPKRRQRKRRFVSPPALAEMARVLEPGAEFRFASDIDDYLGWTLDLVARNGAFDWPQHDASDWQIPYGDWPGTRYEAKALREGRRPSYLRFVRRAG